MDNTLWLCLRFPQLPLDIALRGSTTLDGQNAKAIVVLEKQRVAFANAVAQAAGVTAGMSLMNACALAPAIQTLERQPPREEKALRFLADWAYQFTPAVSLQPPDALLLEIAGCLRLFRGLDNLRQRLDTGLQQLGFIYASGLAHTPKAALAFSHRAPSQFAQDDSDLVHRFDQIQCHPTRFEGLEALGPGTGQNDDQGHDSIPSVEDFLQTDFLQTDFLKTDFLKTLQHTPLSHLALDAKQQRQLRQLGLSRTGELLALPRAELGQRFGKDFVIYLEQLAGERPDLQTYITPSPCFESEIHFPGGLSTIEMLTWPVRRLLQELHQYLSQRQLYCSGFCWRFQLFDKQTSTVRIELSRGQNRVENFFALTRLQLEKRVLSAAVETVQLQSDQLVPATPDNHTLFRELSGSGDSDPWLLLDKLRGRLGTGALFGLQLQDEHLPELRQRKVPVAAPGKKKSEISGIGKARLKSTGKSSPNSLGKSLQNPLGRAPPMSPGDPQHNPRGKPPESSPCESPQKSPGETQPGEQPLSLPLPLWLFEPPQPLKRRRGALYFRGTLTPIAGPRRFDSHWWQARQRRDYFIARHQDGGYYWIFRDPQCRHWYVHGLF